jgi:hypothetical protein
MKTNPGRKRKATVDFDLLRAALDQLSDMLAELTAKLRQRNEECER